MPRVPAEFCLRCGYRLTGLPPRHRCPECGVEYDEHIRVWKPARRRKLIFAGLGLAVGPCIALPHVMRLFITARAPMARMMVALLLLFYAGAFVVAINALARTWRRGFRVWFCGAGVGVRASAKEVVVRWTQIVRMKRGERYGFRSARLSVTLERAGGPDLPIVHFFADGAELDDFVAEFESARRAYLARMAEPAPTAQSP